jgi:hypothetical protein
MKTTRPIGGQANEGPAAGSLAELFISRNCWSENRFQAYIDKTCEAEFLNALLVGEIPELA